MESVFIKHYNNNLEFSLTSIKEKILNPPYFIQQKSKIEGDIDSLSLARLKARCNMAQQRIIFIKDTLWVDLKILVEALKDGYNTFETITNQDEPLTKGEVKEKEIKENDPVSYLARFDNCNDRPTEINIEATVYSVKTLYSSKHAEVRNEEKSIVKNTCKTEKLDVISDENILIFYYTKQDGSNIIYCYEINDILDLFELEIDTWKDYFSFNRNNYYMLPNWSIPIEEISLKASVYSGFNTIEVLEMGVFERKIHYVYGGQNWKNIKQTFYRVIPSSNRNVIFPGRDLSPFLNGLDNEYQLYEDTENHSVFTKTEYQENEPLFNVVKRFSKTNNGLLLDSDNNNPSESKQMMIENFSHLNYYKWHRLGRLHRENDEAAFVINSINPTYYWFKNGLLNRDNNKPAIREMYGLEKPNEAWNPKEQVWFKNGFIYREGNLPAKCGYYPIGTEKYKITYENGLLHSFNDKPAYIELDEYIIDKLSREEWYENGLLHRDNNEPALICYKERRKEWYTRGVLNRDGDEPAIIVYEKQDFKQVKEEVWVVNGIKTRNGDEPAVIKYIKGIPTEKQWLLNGDYSRLNINEPCHVIFGTAYGQPHTKTLEKWYKNGLLHRDGDEPAVININIGMDTITTQFYKNGKLHREGSPAISIRQLQTGLLIKEEWYNEGLLHREGSPASISYFISKNDEKNEIKQTSENHEYMKREELWCIHGKKNRDGDKPAFIRYSYRYFPSTSKAISEHWFKDDLLHRTTGPAVIEYDEGEFNILVEEWRIDGELHRDDGPALIINQMNDPRFKEKEQWFQNGLLSRSGDDPAFILYFRFNLDFKEKNTVENIKFQETWYIDGRLQRKNEENPTRITYFSNEKIGFYEWFDTDGEYHNLRKDEKGNYLPAKIEFFDNGKLKMESFFINGKQEFITSPITIEYYRSGNVRCKTWILRLYKNENDLYRVFYYDTEPNSALLGNIKTREWISGAYKLSREDDLPARIRYYNSNNTGEITIDGILGRVKKREWKMYGKYDREGDKPDRITYFNHGTNRIKFVKKQEWVREKRKNNFMKEDRPTSISYYLGNVEESLKKYETDEMEENKELKILNITTVRERMAITEYDEMEKEVSILGPVKVEIWESRNLARQFDKPNTILHYKNGDVKLVQWYDSDNLLHMDDKPALVEYYPSSEGGGVKRSENWIHGNKISETIERNGIEIKESIEENNDSLAPPKLVRQKHDEDLDDDDDEEFDEVENEDENQDDIDLMQQNNNEAENEVDVDFMQQNNNEAEDGIEDEEYNFNLN